MVTFDFALKATHPACKHNHRKRIFQFCKMFFTIKLPTLVNLNDNIRQAYP